MAYWGIFSGSGTERKENALISYGIFKMIALGDGGKAGINLKFLLVQNKVFMFRLKKMMLSTEDVLRFFLPEVICDYFEVTRLEDHTVDKRLDVYIDERKVVPLEYQSIPLISYDFTDYTVLQDFPIKGKAVYLHLRRRKWQNKSTGEIVTVTGILLSTAHV